MAPSTLSCSLRADGLQEPHQQYKHDKCKLLYAQNTKTKQRYKKGGLFLILSSHLQLNDLFLEKAESPNILSQSTGQTVRSVTYT